MDYFQYLDYVKSQVAIGERGDLLSYTEILRVLRMYTRLSYKSDFWTPANIWKEFILLICTKLLNLYDALSLPIKADCKVILYISHIPFFHWRNASALKLIISEP